MQRRRGLWRAATSEPRIEQAQNSRPESAHTEQKEWRGGGNTRVH